MNSRGYAFIEFEFKEVAKVVAETMDNYLMFHKILKCDDQCIYLYLFPIVIFVFRQIHTC